MTLLLLAACAATVSAAARKALPWSFTAPTRPPVPFAAAFPVARNPIDCFIHRRLRADGLAPAPAATRRQLIRRLALDLNGLPPTPDEVAAFLADQSPGAVERLVDRLLANPRHGEAMAVPWMDAARYGDSGAMHGDVERYVWAWRRWVIDAFNRNLPYDRFTVEQVAGDLLPGATVDQQIASAFNRHHPTSNEEGSIAEELRVQYVADRVHTTATTWLGLTLECARCHDHKYDPISQREYFAFFAYFNNGADPGIQNGTTGPAVRTFTAGETALAAKYEKLIAGTSGRVLDYTRKFGHRADSYWSRIKQSELASLIQPEGLEYHFPLGADAAGRLQEAVHELGPAANTGIPAAPADGLRLTPNSHLRYDVPGATRSDQPLTISFQIHIKSRNAGGLISRQVADETRRGYALSLRDGKLVFQIIRKWPHDVVEIETQNHLPADSWVPVALAHPASHVPSDTTCYVNGKSTPLRFTSDNRQLAFANDNPIVIGATRHEPAADAVIKDIRIYSQALSKLEIAPTTPYFRTALGKPAEQRDRLEQQVLRDFYFAYLDITIAPDKRALDTARSRLANLQANVDHCLVMGDRPEALRPTFVLERGNYNAPRDEPAVTPAVPAALGPAAPETPQNRLALARWLVHPENPLVGRVVVNRLWQMFFGRGLVTTPADFGNQGSPPSHPELLDWLACELTGSGWDLRRIVRRIVTSHTYQQSARVEADSRDPENLLLGRAPRPRLSAEQIRDQALRLAGLLSEERDGRPAKPYQPPGIWEEVALFDDVRYSQDVGRQLYRRSLYSFWHRSAPLPNMLALDAPTRETCTVERSRTTTPQQALVLLNDVQFVEAARAFAQRQFADGKPALTRAFESATARPPTEKELRILNALLDGQRSRFRADPEAADRLLRFGYSPFSPQTDPVELAAWTAVCQALLNLDEVLHRN